MRAGSVCGEPGVELAVFLSYNIPDDDVAGASRVLTY